MMDIDNYSYKIGITSIDEQHHCWLKMMKQLIDYKDAKDKELLVLKTLDELIAYTDMHFAYEEDLFKKYGYPGAGKHLQDHHTFIKKLYEIERDVRKDLVPACTTLLAPMKSWLVEHISKEDKLYVEFLLSKGVE